MITDEFYRRLAELMITSATEVRPNKGAMPVWSIDGRDVTLCSVCARAKYVDEPCPGLQYHDPSSPPEEDPTPTPEPDGVWMGYFRGGDGSAFVPFATELDALRWALPLTAQVKFVRYGDKGWSR